MAVIQDVAPTVGFINGFKKYDQAIKSFTILSEVKLLSSAAETDGAWTLTRPFQNKDIKSYQKN